MSRLIARECNRRLPLAIRTIGSCYDLASSEPGGLPMRIQPVFLFDLDGTLVDSVYQHVLAWKEALDSEGIALSVWRIHRKIGMSGGLFTDQLLRETHGEISAERAERLRHAHTAAYQRMRAQVCPLPG